MLNFQWYPFSELSLEQLYAALKLRTEVFVVEQNCPYPEVDGKDLQALHLIGMENNQLVAYLRLFPPTKDRPYLIFGRITTDMSVRRKGYGKKLMEEMLAYAQTHFPNVPIQCSAQHRLEKFYEGYGFKSFGDVYLEDDMPHIAMRRDLGNRALTGR